MSMSRSFPKAGVPSRQQNYDNSPPAKKSRTGTEWSLTNRVHMMVTVNVLPVVSTPDRDNDELRLNCSRSASSPGTKLFSCQLFKVSVSFVARRAGV